ncbi:TetR/AcrR family transcriptional regulator [uncultured Methanomethylovorans sp.]|uniref:TetR/AcrR family transcriptional regulator n=1 Tax=uncultured Methanomethylovorans sp. TaxID=183759 RepID=UPI002AA77B1E|nr:TetR/AcrR family transcriptional regulator [uncultured Methanomethylovorans sp.]
MEEINNTNQQILSYGRTFLQCRGYNGFSYRDISQKLGIKNAAIHHYYPQKEDLVATIFERIRQQFTKDIAKMAQSGCSAREQLQYFFDFMLREFDEGRNICPIGSLILNFEELPKKVKEQHLLLLDNVLAWLSGVLRIGMESNEFDFSEPADMRAEAIVETLLGARQLASIKLRKTLERSILVIKSNLGWKN